MKDRKKSAEFAICRPLTHLAAIGKSYPKIWRMVELMRADPGGYSDWPNWCYMPLAGSYAIVSGGGSNRIPLHRIGEVARMAALTAWRVTQGVYRFNPTIFQMISTTPIEGDLPCEILYRLPEWCVYIETPEMRCLDSRLYGFFAHLESDSNTGGAELRLLLDTDEGLHAIPIHLGPWSLSEGLRRMGLQSAQNTLGGHFGALFVQAAESMRPNIEPLVSLLLYLCSENSEIGDGIRRPVKPVPRLTKDGPRLIAPSQPTIWEVGARLGASIRHASSSETDAGEGTYAVRRPHIRRAHWHGYWSGPSKFPDGAAIPTANRKFDLKWLPPIAVNVEI